MKKFLVLSLTAAALSVFAAEAFKTDFTQSGGDSGNWTKIIWEGYQPAPEIRFDAKEKAWHFSKVAGQSGFAMANHPQKLKAKAGDVVQVKFTVKGTGEFFAGLQTFSRGNWVGVDKNHISVIAPEWKEYQLSIPVNDLGNKPTDLVLVTFGAKQNADFFIRDFSAEVSPGKYAGTLRFPRKWTLFSPVSPEFQPDAAQLNTIPETFGGIKAVRKELFADSFDFADVARQHKLGMVSWAFAQIEAPCDDYEYTLGAGADWWMQYFVNGKTVIDTSARGNANSQYAVSNHIATVKLKKGVNTLAIRHIAGKQSAVLLLGGPNELRNMTRNVETFQVLTLDDYDNAALKRPGNPEIIQGNPAPGLLSITGQGVYRTAKDLQITAPQKPVQLTGEDWFTAGIRIQNFGQQRRDASLDLVLVQGQKRFALEIGTTAAKEQLLCRFMDGETVVRTFEMPYKMLPADFQFSFSQQGDFILTVTSLADSSRISASGSAEGLAAMGKAPFESAFIFRSRSANTAEITVDNCMTGLARPGAKNDAVPFSIALDKTFDPVKAGWKLVFNDEFEGSQIDWNKWLPRYKNGFASLDGKGHLLIKCDYDKDGKNLTTESLWSKTKFKYGYFEARLRFTRQPGWWAAFWLYGDFNSNPFMDGFEIDIFEDYYNRPKRLGSAKYGVLDHNLHVYTGSLLKSWNYNSQLTRSLDDFYVLGCKWTPFEITYYLDGKLIASSANHSPYSSVTFDAFHHAAGITPLHAIVSGQIMGPTWHSDWGAPSEGKFPEYYMVDYVRVYGYPDQNKPSVSWSNTDRSVFAKIGDVLKFQADAKPNAGTGAKIKAVYLFDNGYLIDFKTKPPYTFEVPFTRQYFERTRYLKPGRSGKKPEFNGYVHNFVLFAQDADGQVVHSDTIMKLPYLRNSTPYKGKPHEIPGVILPGQYDEGGQDVAYHDTTKANQASKNFRTNESVDCTENSIGSIASGEWVNYSVNIAKAGKYTATLRYGTPISGDQAAQLFLDGKPIGTFRLVRHESEDWNCDSLAEIKGIQLPAGRHVLTVLMIGGFNMAELTFKAE